MIGIGVNFANNLKAKNFLGTLSIRNGLFFIAIQQFLLGISLYSVIIYLHPSMSKLAWLVFIINAISAVLGFFGALKRNIIVESVYLVFYFISLLIVLLMVLDMAELVHLFPKAPQLRNLSNMSSLKSMPHLRARNMSPHSFIKQKGMSRNPSHDEFDLPLDDDDDELDFLSDELGNIADSDASTDVEDAIPLLEADELLRKKQAQRRRMRRNKVDNTGVSMPHHKDYIEATDNIKDAPNADQYQSEPSETKEDAPRVEIPLSSAPVNDSPVSSKTGKMDNKAVRSMNTEANRQAPKEAAKVDDHEESFYDSIPLIPHLGETEGEAEEVSREELPPETMDLSPQGVSEVVALYKIQKRPLKMAAAAVTTIALLFNIYCYWVAVTFVLNKCTCLDELVSHPEQFTPLID